MKTKQTRWTFILLLIVGTAAFWVMPSDVQASETDWEAWIDEQTDTVLKGASEIDAARRTEVRERIRSKFAALAGELKNEITSPPHAQDYIISQKVKVLRDAYDTGYDRKHRDASVRVSYKLGSTEIFGYDEKLLLAKVDEKYPRNAWLEMLLDKGVTIENAAAYWEYLFLRDTLVHLETQPNVWKSGLFGIAPTEDWETYKAAYLQHELGQIKKRLEKAAHPFLSHHGKPLESYQTFTEKGHGLHFHRNLAPNFPEEPFRSMFKTFSVPQTLEALREAYDEKYNERYAMTTGSFSYTLEGSTVFEYKIPLQMSEVDAKYPRDAWLQMLLDKGITIDNFEEYWAYLSKRDTLVELEKQPAVWASGLFGIAPTEDWETYKAAYLGQMLEKLHQQKRQGIYFGKIDVDVTEAVKQAKEQLKKLERPQHPPFRLQDL